VVAHYKGDEIRIRVKSSQSNGKIQSFLRTHGKIIKEYYLDNSVVTDVLLGRNQLPQLKSLGAEIV